jgi:hypothetical protein
MVFGLFRRRLVVIKRFLTVAVAGGLLAGSVWLTAGPAVLAGEDPSVPDDPHSYCTVCW